MGRDSETTVEGTAGRTKADSPEGSTVLPSVEDLDRRNSAGDAAYLPFGRPNFSDEEIEAVARVMRTGWIGMGPETIAFEKELSRFLGAPHVVTVSSCTWALFLSLLVHGIGPDDEVICPSLTWFSTANAALYLGARPVFCDIDPHTLSVTPETIKEKLTDRTRAVVVVHMGGYAVDVDEIRGILPDGVAIVEDAAHALGSRFADGRPVGSSGNLTCFSFYANKNLSTGEGGAIALHDGELAGRLCSLRQHGLAADAWRRYSNPRCALVPGLKELGYKMNFTDLQACIGRVQLRRQGEFARIRKEIARLYHDALDGRGVTFQKGCLDDGHSRHLFTVLLPLEGLVKSRDEFVLELRRRKIGAAIHYSPLHRMPHYERLCSTSLPNTEFVSQRIITLPISASMGIEDARRVLEEFTEILEASRSVTGRAGTGTISAPGYVKSDGSPGKVTKPVFIVGCGRSGTTFLFNIMKKHPRLRATTGYPDGEDHTGWIKHGGCIISGLGHAHIEKGHTGYHYCLYMDEKDVTPRVVESMHRYYHEDVLGGDGSKRVLNKCPHLSNKLRYVRAIFPDAKFIHIIRDCLPVVSSWIKIMETQPHLVLYLPDDEYPCHWVLPAPPDGERETVLRRHGRIFPGGGVERLVDYWSIVNRNIPLQLLDTPGQLLTVRYEDLCADTAETLRRICRFCEIPSFDEIPEEISIDVTLNNNEKYKTHLTEEQITAFLKRSEVTRSMFGYV